MTDQKKDVKKAEGQKETKQQIKASKGAWWKSTVVAVEESKAAAADSAPAAPADQKRKPRGRKPKAAPAGETLAAAPAGDSGAEAVKGEAPPARRKRRSSSARKKAARAEAVPGKGPEIEPTRETEAAAAAPEAEEAGAESEPGTAGAEPAKSRRGRGRRGGRKKSSQQKQQAKKGDETDGEAGEPAGGIDEDESAEWEDTGADEAAMEKGTGTKPVVKLLINAEEPEECRLALLEDGRLESIHVSTVSRVQTRNNIYKARIVAIEPNLQAAFIDYGTEKNGFLPFNEIHPEYYKQDLSGEVRKLVETHQWKKLSISDVMERGQEVLVQVVKEEVGKKGANMTTYLSLPGRCVVLMPGSDSEGVSRRISGEERRNQLREIMNSLGIPEGIGWIVRTASIDITKTALSKDVTFLLKLWEEIKAKGQHMHGVGLLYQDYNCVMRFLREYFDPAIQEILVDDEATLELVREFVDMLPPKQRTVKVKMHRGARPIFNQYSVEDQIESIYQSRVNLPSGGSIVIDPTEALVAIDVNSGSTAKGKNFEETIFHANMEAATELARQLRLRDLGGLVVVDFIDMRSSKHTREVEKQVKNAMKRDKAKVDISRISRFGLMQISRQKLGSPIEAGNYRVCEFCRGRGTVRSVETLALFYLRRIHTGASRRQITRVECHFPLDVAQYLLNNKRQELIDLEEKYQTMVVVTADPSLKPAEHEILFQKAEKEETGKKQA